ncbi:MAG: PmbA/TldA family metallopeptidase, partial [Henriciella sp.]
MSDHKPSQIRDAERILSQLLDVCAQNGATAADVSLGHSQDTRVEVQKGQLDTLERSESIGVSLRCFVGQRQAHVSGSDVSEAALADLADRCVAMAKVVPEDQYCGLADASELATEM